MALEIKLKKGTISEDATTYTVVDNTGVYNVSTNPGGFGTPNPDRDDIAIFLVAYNKRSDEDLLLEIATYDPETDTTYTITRDKDGWQQIKVYGLDFYDVATSFDLNEATYHVASEEIRKILTKTGSGPYTYTYLVIEAVDLDSTSISTAYSNILNTIVYPDLCNCLNSANKQAVEDWDDEVKKSRWQQLLAMKIQIDYNAGVGAWTDAELILESSENICACIEVDTCNC